MTSLPMPPCEPHDAVIALSSALPPHSEISRSEGEEFLLRAFRSFAEAAEALEHSYSALRSEVSRLRQDLEESNADLKRSLQDNVRMRKHLDRILDGLPCGVLVESAVGEISLLNPAGRHLLGMDVAKGPGTKPLCPVPDELRELLERARRQPADQEQYFRDESGGERWLAVRHAAVSDAQPDGNSSASLAAIFILQDVTEAKHLLQEREQLRREQALAEISAVLAHEVRNPLGSLELFAGLLAGAGLSAECRQWVEHLQAGLRTLAATVNNVLHFHSLPAPRRTPTDLGKLLDWAGGFLLPMARQARVEICLRNRLDGIWFAADRHRLEQVLLNLVLNALRAMPSGGWVEIAGHVKKDAHAAIISVCDTGPGIAPGTESRIFQPGFSTRAGSPGLGLAVCRKIVEQHGGSLEAVNRAGAGASFTLTLPLEETRQ